MNFSAYIKPLRFFLLVAALMTLKACILPEKFTSHLHIDKDQNFVFRYEGTVVHALMLDPKNKPSASDIDKVTRDLVNHFSTVPQVTTVNAEKDGRVRIIFTEKGRVRDQAEELFGGIKMVIAPDQSITVMGPKPIDSATLQEIDYQPEGILRVTTEGSIQSHNGTEAKPGMLDGVLSALGMKGDHTVQGDVSWKVTKDTLLKQPYVTINGIQAKVHEVGETGAGVVFTSNVQKDDPANRFAVQYLQTHSQWKGDTITWQIRTNLAGGLDGVMARSMVEQLKSIDLRVNRTILSQADQLNGLLEKFRVDVHASVIRSHELIGNQDWSKWSQMPQYYSPFVLLVERNQSGYVLRCDRMNLTGDVGTGNSAISPILDRMDANLSKVSYPLTFEPDAFFARPPANLTETIDSEGGSPSTPASNQGAPISPTLGQTGAMGKIDQGEKAAIKASLVLHHEWISRQESFNHYAQEVNWNGKLKTAKEIAMEQKAYREVWTEVLEFPFDFHVQDPVDGKHEVRYTLVHQARSQTKGKYFQGYLSMTVEVESLGDKFFINRINSKLIDHTQGELSKVGPALASSHCLEGRKMRGSQGSYQSPDDIHSLILTEVTVSPEGKIMAFLEWPDLKSKHAVTGQAFKDYIVFEDSTAIVKGAAAFGHRFYAFLMEDGSFEGTWSHIKLEQDIYESGLWRLETKQ